MYALLRSSVHPSPEPSRLCSMACWSRRRAIGESAEALLVIFTTCSTPAATALSTTASSCSTTAKLTSTTEVTPRIARSTLARSVKSPSATCTSAAANAAACSGRRAITRTSWPCSASSRAAADPTLPVVVTRIM